MLFSSFSMSGMPTDGSAAVEGTAEVVTGADVEPLTFEAATAESVQLAVEDPEESVAWAILARDAT